VTPAHDPNDFAMGLRHNLQRIAVIDEHARMTAAAGPYRGQDRFEARASVLQDLESRGLIEKVQEHALSVGACQRCKTVVEPLVSMQWFMKMKSLAEPAIQAVKDGRIRVLPESGLKKYLNWMENIYDWCISRQLWWGHRIPVWYCDACGEVIAARESPSVCPKCSAASLREGTDVLDTWFSSALWPFATLGWPEKTADLVRFYPNNLMIMGEDILFFWGARMMMMGMKLMAGVPFRELYVHALVRDAERQKMSKTKGNVLDPLEITEKYGTDATRFALAISAAPGTDIAFGEDKVESYRAFANKIWNAGRFILMNLRRLPEPARNQLAMLLEPVPDFGFDAVAHAGTASNGGDGQPLLVDRWIFSRLAAVTREMNEALASFRFHEAAHTIYHFFWHEFCDWYLEWVKREITAPSEGSKLPAAWINLARVFEAALHLLHPFVPFITEELWQQLVPRAPDASISLQRFDLVTARAGDSVSEREFDHVRELVIAVRNAKSERGLQRDRPSAQVASDAPRLLELFRQYQEPILRLAGLEALNFTRGRLSAGVERIPVSASVDLRLFHEIEVDPSAERERLEKERGKLEQLILQAEKQLQNDQFRSRAPREVVRGVEQRHTELSSHLRKVIESLDRLQRAG
jgi:valyl-tRNA synthetase